MSALFILLVLAPEAYLHSPLALLRIIGSISSSYRLCTEFYLFSFQPISTASSYCLIQVFQKLFQILITSCKTGIITENARSSYTIGNMMPYKKKS